ncbi:hypothetical protein Syun_030088 [Stephania yunnanensis]|uniref:Uncharacterized protein n=1 Tax=Stephania yunnanensis TaxID=152371 RepID=A0AAP0E6U7_9MAGN
MSNQGKNSYNLREMTDRDNRNWHAQMEQHMIFMDKTYQNAVHNMRFAQDQRLADMAQLQERNMAHILELMEQGNIGAEERALERHKPNTPLAPIHEDHLMEEGVDSATAAAAATLVSSLAPPKIALKIGLSSSCSSQKIFEDRWLQLSWNRLNTSVMDLREQEVRRSRNRLN